MTDPLDQAALRQRVQRCIDDELIRQREVLRPSGSEAERLLNSIGALLAGGKRLRAGFLYWGYRATGGPDSGALIRLASAMEFFQAAALIHDDVMDRSETRRGLPTAHRTLAQTHLECGWSGDAEKFGQAGAILAGNLCLTWTDELFATCGLPEIEIARGRGLFDQMRTQLMAGQFLDVVDSMRPWEDFQASTSPGRAERARHVARFKSAKYSVEHPLTIGASIGGAGSATVDGLAAYGLDVGVAFQLRDDILGVFGDPLHIGKPAGDDLREGKRTLLIAHAFAQSSEAGRDRLRRQLGRDDLSAADIDTLRELIVDSGALAAVESEIDELTIRARGELATVPELDTSARQALDQLIDFATTRTQ